MVLVWLCLQRWPDKNGDWLPHMYAGTKPYWSVGKSPPVLSLFKSFPSIYFHNAHHLFVKFQLFARVMHLLINTEAKVLELQK